MLKKVEKAAGRIFMQVRSVLGLQRQLTDGSPKCPSFLCFRQDSSLGLGEIMSVFSKASLSPQGSSS